MKKSSASFFVSLSLSRARSLSSSRLRQKRGSGQRNQSFQVSKTLKNNQVCYTESELALALPSSLSPFFSTFSFQSGSASDTASSDGNGSVFDRTSTPALCAM